jgi:hypothetical protein
MCTELGVSPLITEITLQMMLNKVPTRIITPKGSNRKMGWSPQKKSFIICRVRAILEEGGRPQAPRIDIIPHDIYYLSCGIMKYSIRHAKRHLQALKKYVKINKIQNRAIHKTILEIYGWGVSKHTNSTMIRNYSLINIIRASLILLKRATYRVWIRFHLYTLMGRLRTQPGTDLVGPTVRVIRIENEIYRTRSMQGKLRSSCETNRKLTSKRSPVSALPTW